ncbi:hypothetical protein [Chitinophaga sp.]|uniref:hypothetical protein n=1 Tax=Chitinophaga sp. TaxID=1869181 RepID=UPI002F95916F
MQKGPPYGGLFLCVLIAFGDEIVLEHDYDDYNDYLDLIIPDFKSFREIKADRLSLPKSFINPKK